VTGLHAQLTDQFGAMARRLRAMTGGNAKIIPDDMSFREWCESLARDGLLVDGKPFTLKTRPTLTFLYDLIPTHAEEAAGRMFVVQKGAQMGLTVWEMLADLYMSLKWTPLAIGLYLPDRSLAAHKSSYRFLKIVRTVPAAYDRMVTQESPAGGVKKAGEGNVLTRVIGESLLLFLWTSGAVTTESHPLDVVSFDEVQGMTPDDVDRTRERMSASAIKFTLALSTPKWPDADINFWFKLGTQHKFFTHCAACGEGHVLAEHWPECVAFDAELDDYRYVCPGCGAPIDDTQAGEWVATVPDAKIISVQLSQILSPTITASEMMLAWQTAVTSAQKQNFYIRKLGLPYADPDQIPVNLAILNQCAEEGRRAGVVWKDSGKGTFMGIDQMGAFNVAIIKERLKDGRQAVIHVEAIYDDDPFRRCDVLMDDYDVVVCVVEILPNYNDAKRFAGRHRGRVFLVNYADLKDDMLAWGDAVVSKADRKTAIDERDRYTVTLHQYKCMQVSMARFVKRACLFPDPDALKQPVKEKGRTVKQAICREMVFLHLTKVALVVEKDAKTRKYRPKVVKVGIDPHFAYANMLCDVAWARAHGTTTFMIPEGKTVTDVQDKVKERMPGLPEQVVDAIKLPVAGEVCGRCQNYDAEGCRCALRKFTVKLNDPGCPLFLPAKEEAGDA